jgi:hypothetical protein
MGRIRRREAVGTAIAIGVGAGGFFAAVGPAAADGPCGQDYDSATACAINSASTPSYTGSIVANNDVDYYVFYAQKDTKLSTSITDTESPLCSTDDSDVSCGQVSVELYDASGDDDGGPGGYSSPNNGITVPVTWSTIITNAGIYYLEANGNPSATPYTLSVSGTSPAIVWPEPAPVASPSPAPSPAPTKPTTALPKLPTQLGGSKGLEVRPSVVGWTGDGTAYLGGPTGRRSIRPYHRSGSGAFGHITWTSWTSTKASGSGADWLNNGRPDDARGTFFASTVKVVAYDPVKGVFTRLSIVGKRRRFTLRARYQSIQGWYWY